MKILAGWFALTLGAVTLAQAADDGPLKATELAMHLHIFSWVTKVDLQGSRWKIEVVHVKDGKIQSTLLFNDAFPTDRPFERIVILADQTPNGTKVSIQPGASAKVVMGRDQPSETVPLTTVLGLEDQIGEGDYFLGGDGGKEVNQVSGPLDLADVKDGLVLRLHKRRD